MILAVKLQLIAISLHARIISLLYVGTMLELLYCHYIDMIPGVGYFSLCTKPALYQRNKKTHPNALLSYISTQEFLRTQKGIEKDEAQPSVLKNSQVLI